jgi:hypothetical protein
MDDGGSCGNPQGILWYSQDGSVMLVRVCGGLGWV